MQISSSSPPPTTTILPQYTRFRTPLILPSSHQEQFKMQLIHLLLLLLSLIASNHATHPGDSLQHPGNCHLITSAELYLLSFSDGQHAPTYAKMLRNDTILAVPAAPAKTSNPSSRARNSQYSNPHLNYIAELCSEIHNFDTAVDLCISGHPDCDRAAVVSQGDATLAKLGDLIDMRRDRRSTMINAQTEALELDDKCISLLQGSSLASASDPELSECATNIQKFVAQEAYLCGLSQSTHTLESENERINSELSSFYDKEKKAADERSGKSREEEKGVRQSFTILWEAAQGLWQELVGRVLRCWRCFRV